MERPEGHWVVGRAWELHVVSEESANSPDDFALMAAIAGRDRQAFATFYQRHSATVYALCLRILGNHADAEEVFSACFLEIWERADRFEATRASPLTYLITLTRSRAIDHLRRGRARLRLRTEQADAPQADAPTPLGDCVEHEEAAVVREALGQLDAGQRQAIDCAYFEGLSHSQIAEKLGRSLGTVKTQIRQGLIRLRALLRIADRSERP